MRTVSAEEAVDSITSGDQVYVHCAAATPSVLLDALVDRAPELRDVGVVHLHCEGPGRTSRPRWPATSATAPCSSDPTRGPP